MTKQKVVIKLFFNGNNDRKSRDKAFKIVASQPGFESAALTGQEKNQLEIIGEIDAAVLTSLLRKKLGQAELLSVGPVPAAGGDNKGKDKGGFDAKPQVSAALAPYQIPYYYIVPQYPIIYDPLKPLQQIEDQWGLDMPETLEDRIKFLKREFKFLDIFLSLQNFSTDERDILQVKQKVQSLFQDAAVDIEKVHKIEHVDRVTSQLQEKIRMTKLEIRAVYSLPKVSADKDSIATPEFVLEFIDAVIGSLGDLVKIYQSSSLLFVPGSKKELGDVFKELKFLRNFVCFVSDRSIEHNSLNCFFTHVLVVAGHAAMLAWLYLPNNGNKNRDLAPDDMNGLLSDLLLTKIKPIKPTIRNIYIDVLEALRPTIHLPIIRIKHVADCRVGFVETLRHNLKESNPRQIVAWRDQIAAFEEMLNLLITNLIRLSEKDLTFHLQDIDTVMVDSGLLVCSLYEDLELGDGALDFLGQRIKVVIYHIIRKEFQSNLPRIHGLGYVDFFLNNLNEFQDRYSDSLAFVKTQLQIIQKELESLQPFLMSVVEERHNNDDKIQHYVAFLIGKASEVEYVVDACVSKIFPDWCLVLWLLDIIEEIRAEVPEIQKKKLIEVDLALHATKNTGTDHSSSFLERIPRMNEPVIGFEDVIEKLRDQLIRGSKELDVISIVGMPGLGKTTLANRLYFDKSVTSYFDTHAHCCVSQVYSLRGLLLYILTMLDVAVDKTKEPNELAETLRKFLYSKRYLILVDDLWETTTWDDLRPCFPNVNNGSRIILTTRCNDVVEHAKCLSEPLLLRMFDHGESWMLLQIKVFGVQRCPYELELVGQEIARKCGGLPLSIVLVAGILVKMEKTEGCWSQVAKTLGSYIHSDPMAIVDLSYNHLPYHLKSCFLYFGTFLEDEEINVSKLTWLWIGEGLIKGREGKTLEDIIEGYLENLISRNLVMEAKRSFDGRVKACSIHDLLLDFCKRKAEEEHLLQWIIRDKNTKSSSSIFSHKQLAQRRLAFYGEEDNLVEWSSSWSPVDSVLYREDGETGKNISGPQVSRIFHNFKFLKVLDLETVVIYSFPSMLVYLRYFAARTAEESITSHIVNLWNLETLILKPRKGKLRLPITVWKMVKLRHLCIDNVYFTLNSAKDAMENLEILSSPCFSCVNDVELLSRKTPHLRELRCSFVDFGNEVFPRLDCFLTQLETLKIHLTIDSMVGPPYYFPSSLRSLTLSNFFLGSCHESNISVLPNLQVLKLVSIFFDKDEWKVSDGEFLNLKFLKLVSCDFFEVWDASDGAFPRLEHLVLHECPYLKVIPNCFEDAKFLKSIKVKSCNESVAEAAMSISDKGDRFRYATEKMQLHVKHKNS